jgi:hypothetical protein
MPTHRNKKAIMRFLVYLLVYSPKNLPIKDLKLLYQCRLDSERRLSRCISEKSKSGLGWNKNLLN